MKLAHILNVTEINESKKASYLHIAQPITMKTMSIAKRVAADQVDVELIALKHKSENVQIPKDFVWAKDIDKYAWEQIDELKCLASHRPLPLLTDIILAAYNNSDADYLIYTNLDIGLFPEFYLKVAQVIENGYDAFFINRRDCPKKYDDVLLTEDTLELIFSMMGVKHPGLDCFVFKRDIIPSLNLGKVFIGYPPIGQVLKSQIELHSKKTIWLKDERLTFHIGSDRGWGDTHDPYEIENRKQSQGLFSAQFTWDE